MPAKETRRGDTNALSTDQQFVAEKFAGFGGVKGLAHYEGAEWITLDSGAPVLADALASIDCEVEEIIERHSHAIICRAVAVLKGEGRSLVYSGGKFSHFTE